MAKSLSDTDTLLQMSVHYATNHTRAHTLRENAPTIGLSPLAATMRRVNWYTRPFGNPRKVGEPSTARRT